MMVWKKVTPFSTWPLLQTTRFFSIVANNQEQLRGTWGSTKVLTRNIYPITGPWEWYIYLRIYHVTVLHPNLSAEILLELFATSDPKPGRVRLRGGQWLCLVATFALRIPMGRVRYIYLQWMVDFYGKCRWIYQSHGSVMGLNLLNLDLFVRWLVSTNGKMVVWGPVVWDSNRDAPK